MATYKYNFNSDTFSSTGASGAGANSDAASSISGSFALDSDWFRYTADGGWKLKTGSNAYSAANILAVESATPTGQVGPNLNILMKDPNGVGGADSFNTNFTTASSASGGATLSKIDSGEVTIKDNGNGNFSLTVHDSSGTHSGTVINFDIKPNGGVFSTDSVSLNADKSYAQYDFGSTIKDYFAHSDTVQGVVCFAKGTQITTARGPVAVEKLKQTDTVLTISGNYAPLKWVGHRRVDCKRHSDPAQAMPVCIHKDAFGDNLPVRDLYVSPLHSVYVDGHFIPALDLVNGLNVTQENTSKISYYHVELENHNVIYAEGLPAESYLDDGNRSFFSDTWAGEELPTISPEFSEKAPNYQAIWAAKGFASVVRSGPIVETLRATLLERSKRDQLQAA